MTPAHATLSVPEFQARWRNTQLSERAAAQPHFIDLCALVGFEPPTAVDQSGVKFTFEKPVRKLDGTLGFADVWHKGLFAWEYKRRGTNLDQASRQIRYYRDDLENPPLLVVTDIENTVVHTNFTNTPRKTYEFTLDDLSDPKHFGTLRNVFHDPKRLRPGATVETVTERAAAQFATLAVTLEERIGDPRRVAHFLVQVLFCLFAEDVGLLPKGLFSKLLGYCVKNPTRFPEKAEQLFRAMQAGGEVAYEPIARFNGGIFASIDVIPLTAEDIGELIRAAELDWGSIEPAIFGTLFERSLDPNQRGRLGAFYTPRSEIERVVDPVLMTPLRRRWESIKAEADEAKQHWQSAPTRAEATKRRAAFRRILTNFQQELASTTILDPACGSGNFLYVALAAMPDLEMEISRYGANSGLSYMLPMVTPTQLFGLELNPYAREFAQVVVWIGHLQWMQDHGFPYKVDPVIDSIETIEIRDALIRHDDLGHVSEAPWPEANFIIGNPPFLGGKHLRSGLGDDVVNCLFSVYDGRVPREADLVCYWFEKARAEVAAGRSRRAGLLATQGIRGGANRRVLERIKESGDIFMAWDDEDWPLNGTNVNISIVGFDDGTESSRTIDGVPLASIHADLTGTLDLTKVRPLPENRNIAFMGDTKGGPFDIPGDLAREWLAFPLNPHARPNSDVVRPSINGLDVTRSARDRWIIDFGPGMSEQEAALYEAPFEYVREHVRPVRGSSRSTVSNWWLHERPRPDMRDALRGLSRFVVTPTTSKHRIFVWVENDALPDHALIAFARDDDYFFGVLHSRAHEVWALRLGTALEDRPRYTPTTCFETFPMPIPTPMHREAISAAAQTLHELRRARLAPPGATNADNRSSTLTGLYNRPPTWLRHLHDDLNRAIWAAYGWDDPDPAGVPDEVILGRLLALNQERASGTASKAAFGHDDSVVAPAPTEAMPINEKETSAHDSLLTGVIAAQSAAEVTSGLSK
jgi:hypothetical protein